MGHTRAGTQRCTRASIDASQPTAVARPSAMLSIRPTRSPLCGGVRFGSLHRMIPDPVTGRSPRRSRRATHTGLLRQCGDTSLLLPNGQWRLWNPFSSSMRRQRDEASDVGRGNHQRAERRQDGRNERGDIRQACPRLRPIEGNQWPRRNGPDVDGREGGVDGGEGGIRVYTM